MGSIISDVTGKGSSSSAQGLSGLTGLGQGALGGFLGNLGSAAQGLGSSLAPYANAPLQGGQSQYQAGLAGNLTPAQQALSDFTLGQNRTAMDQIYSGLGIGDSTMRTQDLNAANLQSLAQQEQIDFANQQMGLDALKTGAGIDATAGQLLGTSGNLFSQAGTQLGGAQNNLNNFLKQLLGAPGSTGTGVAGAPDFSFLTSGPAGASGLSGAGGSGLSELIGSSVGGDTLSSGLGATGIGSGIFDLLGGGSTAAGAIGAGATDAGIAAGASSIGADLASALPFAFLA